MTLQNLSASPVIIVGSGLAGLTVALEIAATHRVVVLAKRSLNESATAWAQGGIVGVIDELDNIEAHVADTLEAGAGLVAESVAREIANHSADAIQWLIDQQVFFTGDPQGPRAFISFERVVIATDVLRMQPMPRARPFKMQCSSRLKITPTLRCSKTIWRWTSSFVNTWTSL